MVLSLRHALYEPTLTPPVLRIRPSPHLLLGHPAMATSLLHSLQTAQSILILMIPAVVRVILAAVVITPDLQRGFDLQLYVSRSILLSLPAFLYRRYFIHCQCIK